MVTLMVPPPLRDRLGDAASDGLVTMFADAHRLATESFEQRLIEVSARFDRKLSEEIGAFRLDMTRQMSELRFDLLKWNFLFWVGQLAALTAILSFVLRSR